MECYFLKKIKNTGNLILKNSDVSSQPARPPPPAAAKIPDSNKEAPQILLIAAGNLDERGMAVYNPPVQPSAPYARMLEAVV
jgi:hypothetical protein